VIEGGDGASFALESHQAIGISRHVFGQYLERHVATELCVRRSVHFTHSARADLFDDAVMQYGVPDQK
jgi:hypothetical protein